jgi:hypothetical protein
MRRAAERQAGKRLADNAVATNMMTALGKAQQALQMIEELREELVAARVLKPKMHLRRTPGGVEVPVGRAEMMK